MTPRHSRHSRGGRGHIGEGEGAEASGFDADGKIYSLDSRHSRRPCSFWRLTAPRAVILVSVGGNPDGGANRWFND